MESAHQDSQAADRPSESEARNATRPAGEGVHEGAASLLPQDFEATGPPLGAGATAIVWPVRYNPDRQEYALKVWRRPFATDKERETFRREVRQHVALARVTWHVVTYTWAVENPPEGTPWMCTQRHGTSLQQVLEAGRPLLPEALTLCADMLTGLAAMHSNKVLHRDVKPANVLADRGRAKLCDFGLAMDEAAYTQDNAAGTPRFIAPELLAGSSRPTMRTDVYSASRTILEVLGSGTPAKLEQLLTEAVSINPNDRPTDAGRFENSFREACRALGHTLPPPEVPPEVARESTDDIMPSDDQARNGPLSWHPETTDPADPISPPHPNWRKVVMALAVLACIAVAGVLIANAIPTGPTARISNPMEGDDVASPLTVRGSTELPSDEELWIMVQPDDNAYYPVVRRSVTPDESGEWSVVANLGRSADDEGRLYRLHAVIVSASNNSIREAVARAESDNDSVRFASLPSDASLAASVSVTLADVK